MKTYIKNYKANEIDALQIESPIIQTRYSDHSHISNNLLIEIFKKKAKETILKNGSVHSLIVDNKIEAIFVFQPLLWDTKHFGQSMARLEIHSKKTLTTSISPAIEQTLKKIYDNGIVHVSIDVDLGNYHLLNALIKDHSFEIMDIKREFRWLSLSRVDEPKLLSRIERYSTQYKNDVLNLLADIEITSRFSNDISVSPAKVKEMYRIWVKNLLSDPDSLCLIYKKNQKIVAFGAISKTVLHSSAEAIEIYDKGIYFSNKTGTGAYYPIIYKLADLALKRTRSVQTSVSISNHAAIRVLEKLNGSTSITKASLRKVT